MMSSALTVVVVVHRMWQPNTLTEGPQCWPKWEPTYGGGEVPNKTKNMRHISSLWNLCILYPVSPKLNTVHHKITFLTQHECSSIPSTGWLFLPNPAAAQLWNSPSLLSKNYSWPLPQQQIFLNSIEAENLWILNVMPVQRHFTFYPWTQHD